MPVRKIASNLLWSPEGLIRNPLVTLSDTGTVLRIEVCDSPDRQPTTEFYAGVLVMRFPEDVGTIFGRLLASRPLRPLPELLAALPTGSAIVVISGLDYPTLRLTPQATIRRLDPPLG